MRKRAREKERKRERERESQFSEGHDSAMTFSNGCPTCGVTLAPSDYLADNAFGILASGKRCFHSHFTACPSFLATLNSERGVNSWFTLHLFDLTSQNRLSSVFPSFLFFSFFFFIRYNPKTVAELFVEGIVFSRRETLRKKYRFLLARSYATFDRCLT